MLIDIGANLTHSSFDPTRRVLARARARAWADHRHRRRGAGIADALELARKHPGILYATAGVHPHHAKDYTDGDAEVCLRDCIATRRSSRSAKRGLDYNRDFSPRPAQLFAFERQLRTRDRCRASRCSCISAMRMRISSRVWTTARIGWSRRGALLHRRARGTVRLSRPRLLHRHHRLDLRRAARHASARTGEKHSGRIA